MTCSTPPELGIFTSAELDVWYASIGQKEHTSMIRLLVAVQASDDQLLGSAVSLCSHVF